MIADERDRPRLGDAPAARRRDAGARRRRSCSLRRRVRSGRRDRRASALLLLAPAVLGGADARPRDELDLPGRRPGLGAGDGRRRRRAARGAAGGGARGGAARRAPARAARRPGAPPAAAAMFGGDTTDLDRGAGVRQGQRRRHGRRRPASPARARRSSSRARTSRRSAASPAARRRSPPSGWPTRSSPARSAGCSPPRPPAAACRTAASAPTDAMALAAEVGTEVSSVERPLRPPGHGGRAARSRVAPCPAASARRRRVVSLPTPPDGRAGACGCARRRPFGPHSEGDVRTGPDRTDLYITPRPEARLNDPVACSFSSGRRPCVVQCSRMDGSAL